MAGDAIGVRVNVEDDGVARCQHRNGIIDDGRGRIRRRRDGGDNAVGRRLSQIKPIVAGDGVRLQVLGARGILSDQQVLEDLIFVASQPGLLVSLLRQRIAVFAHRAADGGDNLVALLQPHLVELAERHVRRLHRAFDGLEHAEFTRQRGSRAPLRRRVSAVGQVADDALGDDLNFLVAKAGHAELQSYNVTTLQELHGCKSYISDRRPCFVTM